MSEKQCNGICVWASELIEGVSGVAYAHPDCELHGDPDDLPLSPEEEEEFGPVPFEPERVYVNKSGKVVAW